MDLKEHALPASISVVDRGKKRGLREAFGVGSPRSFFFLVGRFGGEETHKPKKTKNVKLGGGNSKIFYFHPDPCGK